LWATLTPSWSLIWTTSVAHDKCDRSKSILCSQLVLTIVSSTTCLIYSPQVMKTRLALGSTGQYRGMAHCMKSVVKSEGPLTLYRGMLPSLIGIIPYAGIDLAIYEVSRVLCVVYIWAFVFYGVLFDNWWHFCNSVVLSLLTVCVYTMLLACLWW